MWKGVEPSPFIHPSLYPSIYPIQEYSLLRPSLTQILCLKKFAIYPVTFEIDFILPLKSRKILGHFGVVEPLNFAYLILNRLKKGAGSKIKRFDSFFENRHFT